MYCTDFRDCNGSLINEGDILYNPISGYKYLVKYGLFYLNYTKPFRVKCLGFYVEYEGNDGFIQTDSFAMLDLENLIILRD